MLGLWTVTCVAAGRAVCGLGVPALAAEVGLPTLHRSQVAQVWGAGGNYWGINQATIKT